MASKKKLLQAAAGSAGGAGLDVDEVFSTYLYTGNNDGAGAEETQTITNGIDVSGEGGLVWLKKRSNTGGNDQHFLYDTERGATKRLISHSTAAEGTSSGGLTQFNSDGFLLGGETNNYNNDDYVSWTWRKAPKFFDVVTWTGSNFGGGRQISHNLGSVPGIIIIKRTSAVSAWYVWHRSRPNAYTVLNETDAEDTSNTKYYFGDGTNVVAPTSTEFTTQTLNENGFTYVAYLFAHNNSDGEFGPDGDADIIKCGSYTGNGSNTGPVIDLGFEPQFVMIKSSSASGSDNDWYVVDTMRRFEALPQHDAGSQFLKWNTSDGEPSSGQAQRVAVNSTGFSPIGASTGWNINGQTYIYMAIRRGPLAAPTDATKVFAVEANSSTGITTSFPVDWRLSKGRNGSAGYTASRLTGQTVYNATESTAAEYTSGANFYFDSNTGVVDDLNGGSDPYVRYAWKRAPSYFDVVAYTGNGVNGQQIKHNLGVPPELTLIKNRGTSNNWLALFYAGQLASGDGWQSSSAFSDASSYMSSTFPNEATYFGVSANSNAGASSNNYIAYLFATVAGVSKVGSVSHTSGTGSTTNVDCGFSSGARFVILKASSIASQWMVFDTVRGITSVASPFMRLNQTGAEVTSTDIIDPYSTGFTIDPTVSTGTYIFYAIA